MTRIVIHVSIILMKCQECYLELHKNYADMNPNETYRTQYMISEKGFLCPGIVKEGSVRLKSLLAKLQCHVRQT